MSIEDEFDPEKVGEYPYRFDKTVGYQVLHGTNISEEDVEIFVHASDYAKLLEMYRAKCAMNPEDSVAVVRPE